MAEFISAIIGLVAIGASASHSLYNLVDTVRDAPNEFLALSNEVTDFRLVLSRFKDAWQTGQIAIEKSKEQDVVDLMFKRSARTLGDIDSLARKIVKQQGAHPADLKIHRMEWLLRSKKAKKLQEALRTLKFSLNSLAVTETLNSSAKIGLILEGLQVEMKSIRESQVALKEQATKMNQLVSGQHIVVQQQRLNDHHDVVQSQVSEKAPLRLSSESDVRDLQTRLAKTKPSPYHVTLKVSRSARLQCLDPCLCRCHYRSVLRSPRSLSSYFGDLFFGYSSLPWCLSSVVECNEQTCRRSKLSTAQFQYFFPSWFMSAVASVNIGFVLCSTSLNFCIQTRITIPYDSPIFVAIQEGNIADMKDLLLKGEASLNDVDPYGLGLLYYATAYSLKGAGNAAALQTCRTLLDIGAHVDWEDEIGKYVHHHHSQKPNFPKLNIPPSTPVETLIDHALVSRSMNGQHQHQQGLDPSILNEIGSLFKKGPFDLLQDYLDDINFPPLHKALLGIDFRHGTTTLEEYLSSRPNVEVAEPIEIDAVDARGRTALAWAVEHGWAAAVRTLLEHGANPHQTRPCVQGHTPLLHLLIAGPSPSQSAATTTEDDANDEFLEIIRILLRAGVDVNATDHEGWTALHVAASWNSYDVIKELASLGGDTLKWNTRTDDGQSAWDLSVGGGGDEDVLRLLRDHMDMDGPEESGIRRAESDEMLFHDALEVV
ncbi:MAG: hypothetical protein M1816_003395 [Peltula sp. TS41687]|nr:MAG: hypothetical protein M1816_003395 [Peltula sp. TS41687]